MFTRKIGDTAGWHWRNQGGEEYELREVPAADAAEGSKVVVKIGANHLSHIDEERVRKTIKKYADFIPYNIMLNGNGPVNVVDAPWHRPRTSYAGERDYAQALHRFLNERYPDVPLHIIPINTQSPRASGALYISDKQSYVTNSSGLVDIFQERMAIRMKDQELLPEWAKFITGVIDSPDLQPTAARDNLIKEDKYYRLRKVLGELIIQSLIDLARADQPKFFRICKWHHFHLKGMARNHQEFFDAVIDHLPFETNRGDMTLKDYVGRQAHEPGEKIPVYFFSYGYDSNQFYELCNARGLLTINTGFRYDEGLVRQYVERYSETLELRQMDHLDDPKLFQRLTEEEHQGFFGLENAIRRALERLGLSRVNPQARRFRPVTMSAAVLATQHIEAYDKLESLLQQPFMVEGLGDWAEEVTENLRQQPLDLFLNADNELITMLQGLDNLEDRRYDPILVGVYNSAILYSQHRMTPQNLKVFYDQMQQQMLDTLRLEAELAAVSKEKADLQIREMERAQVQGSERQDHDWVRLFVMMSYQQEFDRLEEVLRAILQAPPYYFELDLARSQIKNDMVQDNIRRHVLHADGYIADISAQSPNVMLELGWVVFEPTLQDRPAIILRSEEGHAQPVDIAGKYNIVYPAPDSPDLQAFLTKQFDIHEPLQQLAEQVRQGRRTRFLSSILFKDFDMLPSHKLQTLCKAFNTVEDAVNADPAAFKQRVAAAGDERLGGVRDAILEHLREL